MTYKYSKTSEARLNTVNSRLQFLMDEMIKHWDITIISGHRDKEEQNKLLETGKSELQWPDSKHNKNPSDAVDFAIYRDGKARWGTSLRAMQQGLATREEINDTLNYFKVFGAMEFIWKDAQEKGFIPSVVKLIFGHDWQGDRDYFNSNFFDMYHVETVIL